MSVLQQAERYCDLGLAVVPVTFRSKACQLDNWQVTRLSKADLPNHFNGAPQNIAAVCGALSGGVVILDCDWTYNSPISIVLLHRFSHRDFRRWQQIIALH